jgi:DNA-binding response OmpR family regulator
MLPGISGLNICLRWRSTGVQLARIMLTAKDEVPDRVTGLNAKADDYVISIPVAPESLLTVDC